MYPQCCYRVLWTLNQIIALFKCRAHRSVGYGYKALKPGEPVPSFKSSHAWNAVRIDDGEWKLIDPCWGAGHVSGANAPYTRKFNSTQFTASNEDFGLKHFPQDASQVFRMDGRVPTWEEYFVGEQIGEPVEVWADPDEGFSNASYLPKQKNISSSPSAHNGPTVRFQFERVCPHWNPKLNGKGKPFQYILVFNRSKGGSAKADYVPFDTNGKFWWADVPIEMLGRPGDSVMCCSVDTVNGQTARGLSKEEYLMAKGRKAMHFQGFANWNIV